MLETLKTELIHKLAVIVKSTNLKCLSRKEGHVDSDSAGS